MMYDYDDLDAWATLKGRKKRTRELLGHGSVAEQDEIASSKNEAWWRIA
jgi:hypothetical protein